MVIQQVYSVIIRAVKCIQTWVRSSDGALARPSLWTVWPSGECTMQPEPTRASVELDRVLDEIGHFGPYQLRLFLAILLPIMFSAVYNAQYVFNAANVNYRCLVPECESSSSSTWQAGAWAQWTLIPGSKCTRRAPLVPGGPCTPDNFGKSTKQCTSWLYQDNNTIISEFNLACDDLKRTLVGAVHSTGVFTTLIYIGIVSDSIGRRMVFILTATLCALPGLARSFATNYYVYLVLEFLDPVLGAGVYTTGFVLVMEMVGPEKRVLCGGLISGTFALGQAILALVAWLVPYWRTLTRILYTPSLFFIFYFMFFQESFRWLYTQKNINEALKILHKVAEANHKPLSEASIKKLVEEGTRNHSSTESTVKHKSSLCQMIQSRVLMSRMVICWYCWLTSTFIYYGLSINSVSLAGSMYVNYALMALVEVPGYTLSVLTLDRFGRKIPLMTFFSMCGFCLIALPFIPTEKDANDRLRMDAGGVMQVVLALAGKLFVSAAFNALYVLTSELFPTPVRHRAVAACSLVARLGQIVAMLTPLLLAAVPWLPFILFGGMSVTAALLMMLAPETLHTSLPDTVAQAERLSSAPAPARAAAAPTSPTSAR